jgi:hypothetical protein
VSTVTSRDGTRIALQAAASGQVAPAALASMLRPFFL